MKRRIKVYNNFESVEIKKNKNINDDTKKIIYFAIILVIALGFIIGLALLNKKFVTKEDKKETTTTVEASIDDSYIIMNDLFKKGEDYYVMLYDKSDETQSSLYTGLIARYSGKKTLYSIDMSLKMNSQYYNKEGKENKTPKKYEDVIITQPTLIKIKNKEVKDYITNKDEIVEILMSKKK